MSTPIYEPKHHVLKILPIYFQAIVNGTKTFEIRDDSDRGFIEGDEITLRELEGGQYSGNEVLARILYVTDFMQQENYVVFSFEVLTIKRMPYYASCASRMQGVYNNDD